MEVGSTICPSVVKTFLNEDTCQKKQSCSEPIYGSASFVLDDTNVRVWYTDSAKYVYEVRGLRLEDQYYQSPCTSGVSRWEKTIGNCTDATVLDAVTLATITQALADTSDANPYVKDINLPTGEGCNGNDAATIGAQVQVGNTCYEHVHPHLHDIRDFSYWVLIHDGNSRAASNNNPHPIAKWAQQGYSYIHFPSNHPMSRWKSRNQYMSVVGRLGDTVNFLSLNTELQTPAFANHVGATIDPGTSIFQSCGSPGEVANGAFKGHYYYSPGVVGTAFERDQLDWPIRGSRGKEMLWTNVVFKSEDQLRQRIAWVLSQILVISEEGIANRDNDIEPWAM